MHRDIIMLFLSSQNSIDQAKALSFNNWITQNNTSIASHLMEAGISFVSEHAEQLKSPLTDLILDNRWHYLDKPKKESYRGTFRTSNDGVPQLNLTYYTFRNGGLSERFDSRAVIKELWMQALSGVTKPVIKPQGRAVEPVKPVENAQPVIDYVAREAALWLNLTPSGVSHYLNRKGLKNTTIPGVRFGRLHIAVQIINATGVAQGLQTIYNDGQKRFTKGMTKKGHFALIGLERLPERVPTLHICEGVATAASIHLSLCEPVFAALDAFNLLPVAKALKAAYPKTQIILWADNDWQKADKLRPDGKPLGNTGLIQANRTAFKLRGTLVCTPDFSKTPDLPPVLTPQLPIDMANLITNAPIFVMNALQHLPVTTFTVLSTLTHDAEKQAALKAQATDFNDLHQLEALSAIAQTTPQKPDIKLALTNELEHYDKNILGLISSANFEQGTRASYLSRYLPKIPFGPGVHLVKSAIGTGKTAVVEALVKAHPEQSVLFTTHLISLVESAATRLDLCSYNTCDNYDLQIESRLAICLNSLGKLTANAPLRDYDIVIIDEIEQVLARLTSKIDQKPLVFSVLQHIMRHAKTLICLDAHLSKTTVQLIQATCPYKQVVVHINHHTPTNKRRIILHDSAESVQLAAMKALDERLTAYLTFNSKADAFKTFSTLKAAFPDKKGLYIASDNAGDAANQAFFKDVNTVSKEYDYLVCTPSVSTGVSIDNGHFDFVGGIFLSNINTANDCMQALGRVRDKEVRHVYCEKRQANHPLDADSITARWLSTHQHDLNLMNLTDKGARVLMHTDYERLCLSVAQNRNASLNDFYQQFALLSLHENIDLSYFDDAPDADTRKNFRQLKQSIVSEEAVQIGTAPLSTTALALRALMNKPRKTMMDTRSYKKQGLIEFYNLPTHDTENIQALAVIDNDGRFKKHVKALELALGDEDLAKLRFLEQTQKHEQFAADVTHFASLQQLYKHVLDSLRLTTSHGLLSVADYHYSREMLINKGFVDYIEDHRDVFKGLLSLPTPAQLHRDPVRFLGVLLSRLGLKQKRVGKSANGMYHLDGERVALLNALIARRRAGLPGVSMPLDTTSVAVKKTTTLDVLGACLQGIKRFFQPDSGVFAGFCPA